MVFDIRTKCYKKKVNCKIYEYCYAEVLDSNRSDFRNRVVVKRLRLDREHDIEELRRTVIVNEIEKIKNSLFPLMKRLELLEGLINGEINIVEYVSSPAVAVKLRSFLQTGEKE